MSSQRKIFLTFGGPTANFHNRVVALSRQAETLRVFDEVSGITDLELKESHPIFWDEHNDFLMNNKRGYGFWFWKPYIIRATLHDVETNDIVIYMDAGCTINLQGKERLNDYINLLNSQSEFDIISFQMCMLPEIKYTKRELLTFLSVSDEDKNSGQCMATVIIMRKGEHSLSVVNEWYKLASVPDLINDKHSLNEDKSFIDHRHDQSIFSLLVKKHGSIKIPDETYFEPNWSLKGGKYPFWATRIRY